MKEIEVKILEIDKNKIIGKLKNLGAKKIFEGEMLGTAFKPPKGIKHLPIIAVRKKGEESCITLKGKRKKSVAKIQEEFEFVVEDYEKAKKMFLLLGFKVLGETEKYRISYFIDGVRFEIDTFKEIPTYLEIEGPSLGKIEKYVKLLGYSMEHVNNYNGYELFKYYGKKFGVRGR